MTQLQFWSLVVIMFLIFSKIFRSVLLWTVLFFFVVAFYIKYVEAEELQIDGRVHGSGNSEEVVQHIPQYMPYYPTAATIWPRTVDVNCKDIDGTITCDGYQWKPEMGRAEYLFINPKIVKEVNVEKVVEKDIQTIMPIIPVISDKKPVVKRKKKLYKQVNTCKIK